jgi:hypothetical protein
VYDDLRPDRLLVDLPASARRREDVDLRQPRWPVCTQPFSSGIASTSLYNDRLLNLDITLPSNYTATYGTNTWWKIRYTVGSSATDRTTWSAKITGNPVHLVQ